MTRGPTLAALGMLLGACGFSDPIGSPPVSSAGDSSGEGNGDDGDSPVTTFGMSGMVEGGGGGDDTTGGAVDEGSEGPASSEDEFGGFIIDPDIIHLPTCNLFDNDCPPGEKCMPYAEGGGYWNATACFPIADDPAAPGESCTAEGSGTSGLDDCEVGSMCWGVDPRTLEGYCVPFCGGSESNPTCEDACTTCSISSGPLALCLSNCDPIGQDCPQGQACYPINADFACAPDASGKAGGAGDPCEFINVCDPGLFCLGGEAWPGCDGAGCCAPACDLGAADPCPGVPAGVECTAWYLEGEAPPDDGCVAYDSIGVCIVPA